MAIVFYSKLVILNVSFSLFRLEEALNDLSHERDGCKSLKTEVSAQLVG